MSKPFLTVTNISFQYDNSISPVLKNASFSCAPGWTGILGPNGSGKTTLLRLVSGLLTPAGGTIVGPERRLYCEQEAGHPPADFAGFYEALYDGDGSAGRLFGLLALGHDWPYRWESLSQGERKRAQLACALFPLPDLIALDEPANHLDEQAQEILIAGMRTFGGTGLLVSHDRAFLARVCSSYLFMENGSVIVRTGSLEECLAQERRERLETSRKYEEARRTYDRLKREARLRRESADRHRKDYSKRGLDRKDHDGKSRIDGLRISDKNGIGARMYRSMADRADRAREEMESIRSPGQRKKGITVHGERSRADMIFRLPAGSIPLGEERRLDHPELVIRPRGRIALTGTNGAGKTTLIREILRRGLVSGISGAAGVDTEGLPAAETLPAMAIPRRGILYLPQELSESDRTDLVSRFSSLPDREKGAVLSRYYRLNGDPGQITTPETLSPGETRKLFLAMGLSNECVFLVLDEPTNHLDISSRESLEEALAGFGGAILLVSHDRFFRQSLTDTEWRIAGGEVVIRDSQE